MIVVVESYQTLPEQKTSKNNNKGLGSYMQ